MDNNEYDPEILILTDEDGKELTFELLHSIEKDGVEYKALVPVDEAGNEIADREIVEVKNGFFARLIAFFRALFGRLRIVEQVFQDVI